MVCAKISGRALRLLIDSPQTESSMKNTNKTGFSDRLQTAAEAKKALLAKFTPKPTVVDPAVFEREAQKAAEISRAREERTRLAAEAKQAAAAAEQAARDAEAARAAEEIAAAEAAVAEEAERKIQVEAAAKAARDARYAARKARR
jgi:hypothetical protein